MKTQSEYSSFFDETTDEPQELSEYDKMQIAFQSAVGFESDYELSQAYNIDVDTLNGYKQEYAKTVEYMVRNFKRTNSLKLNDPCAVFVSSHDKPVFTGTRHECRLYLAQNDVSISLIANTSSPNWEANAVKTIFNDKLGKSWEESKDFYPQPLIKKTK